MKKFLFVFFSLLFCFSSVALAYEETYVFSNVFHGEEVTLEYSHSQNGRYFYLYQSVGIPIEESLFASEFSVVITVFGSQTVLPLSLQITDSAYFLVDDNNLVSFTLKFIDGVPYVYFAVGLNQSAGDSLVANIGCYAIFNDSDPEDPTEESTESESDESIPVESIPDDPSGDNFDNTLGWAGQFVFWVLSTFGSLVSFMVSNSICLIGLIITLVGFLFVYLRNTIGG